MLTGGRREAAIILSKRDMVRYHWEEGYSNERGKLTSINLGNGSGFSEGNDTIILR